MLISYRLSSDSWYPCKVAFLILVKTGVFQKSLSTEHFIKPISEWKWSDVTRFFVKIFIVQLYKKLLIHASRVCCLLVVVPSPIRVHIWRMFHLWLRFITFGGRSAYLAYHVHKSGRKTPIVIIIITNRANQLQIYLYIEDSNFIMITQSDHRVSSFFRMLTVWRKLITIPATNWLPHDQRARGPWLPDRPLTASSTPSDQWKETNKMCSGSVFRK